MYYFQNGMKGAFQKIFYKLNISLKKKSDFSTLKKASILPTKGSLKTSFVIRKKEKFPIVYFGYIEIKGQLDF